MTRMNQFYDKLFFGSSVLLSAASSATGAILSGSESRWLYVTLASSILMSAFLALMFKKPEEAIKLVVGRCGLSVFGGVLLTRPIIHYAKLEIVYNDIIALAGASSAVCVLTFFVGFAFLKIIEAKAPNLAEKLFKKIV